MAKKRKGASSEILSDVIVKGMLEKKAADIVVMDLRKVKNSIADFFVICSGTSEPHLKAIAGEIEGRLKKDHGVRAAAVDGFPSSQWIVLDFMQVIAHVFHYEKRAFYGLEDLWGDASRVQWENAAGPDAAA